jgi:hypothetical protein
MRTRTIWTALLALFVAVCFMGCAGDADARGNPCDSPLGAILNDCSPHTVDTDTDTWRDERKENSEYGVGLDVVIWENETGKADVIEEVVAEYKYDINNDDHQVYTVVRLNLWQKIKGLFNKGEVE